MVSLTSLLEETSYFLPNVVVFDKNFSYFVNLDFLVKGQKDFADNVLYIGLVSDVVELVDCIENAVLFLVRDCTLSYFVPASRNMVIVEYPHETDIFRLFNTVKTLFYREWDLLKSSSVLFNAQLNSSSLDDLTETVARLVQNPVLVMDVSYKVLAYSRSVKIEDVLWLQTLEKGGFTYEYISAIYSFNASKVVPKDNTPYHLKTDMSPARRLISRLCANGVQFGYVATLESNQLFEKINPTLYKLISDVIAKNIQSDKAIQIDKDYVTCESIIVDLIEGSMANKSIFLRSIKDTNLGQKTLFQLICIEISNYLHKDATDNFLKHSLEVIFPRIWTVCYHEHIIVLIDLKSSDCLSAQERLALDRLFEKNDLRAGVSTVFCDLYTMSQYYRQAVRALDIAKLLQTPGRIIDYEQFKFYDMVLSVPKPDDKTDNGLKNYCSSTLLKIQTYDRIHSTEYLKTLWTYLNSNKNLIKTAQKLYIHKNTSAYRIQKLEEFFAIDMDDDFLLFTLYYSYLLLSVTD